MNGPTGSARQRQEGFVAVHVALVASLVLVPLVMLVIDLTLLAYWRTKLRNTADALAIGAVAESRSFHIPIPTEFVGWFPVNGYLFNVIHLSNLETGGLHTGVGQELKRLSDLNQDQIGPQAEVRVGEALVLPLGNTVSPFMYVKIPVEAQVKPLTPFLGSLIGEPGGQPGSVTLKAESCAVAWYRPDSWVHRWWDANPETLVKSIDTFLNLKDEPHKYYRLTNCVDEASDLVSLAELVIAKHLEVNPEAMEALKRWGSRNPGSREIRRAREGMKRPPERCGRGDPCVENDPRSIEEWSREESTRKRAEEEAEKSRQKAIEEAESARQDAPGAGTKKAP